MTDREAYIALNMTSDLGPIRVRNLVEALGSPQAILEATPEELVRVRGIGREVAHRIVEQARDADPGEEIERARKAGVRIITQLDDEYPEPLKTTHDPPLVLYVRGALERRDRHAISVVGSRRCTHYGRQAADRLSYQLAQTGFTVISGLAGASTPRPTRVP